MTSLLTLLPLKGTNNDENRACCISSMFIHPFICVHMNTLLQETLLLSNTMCHDHTVISNIAHNTILISTPCVSLSYVCRRRTMYDTAHEAYSFLLLTRVGPYTTVCLYGNLTHAWVRLFYRGVSFCDGTGYLLYQGRVILDSPPYSAACPGDTSRGFGWCLWYHLRTVGGGWYGIVA